MLQYPVRHYFFAILLILCFFFLLRSETTGFIYALFFLFGIITINFFQSNFYKGAYFVLLFSVTIAYFIRPLILVDHPDMFMYTKIASTTSVGGINRSLIYALVSTACIAAGFIAVIKFTPDKIHLAPSDSNFIMRNFFMINSIIIILTLGKLFLTISTGAGVKGDEGRDSTFAFILKLLSPDLAFVVYYIYLTKYWKQLSLQKKALIFLMIVLTSYSLFVTGSKTFIAMFGLCFFFNFILKNRKIKLPAFILFGIAGFVVLAFSFIVSAAVRYSSEKDLRSVANTAQTLASSESLLTVSNEITKRMMGLDGQIASYIITEQANPVVKNELQQSFSPKDITLHTLTNIIPKVSFISTPASGKVISETVAGKPEDVSHAGSLGLFASVYFISGSYFFLFNLILGALLAFYFIYARKIKNPDLQFIIYFLGCFLIIRTVLSGNFDVVLGEFIPKWVLLYFYIKIISLINAPAR